MMKPFYVLTESFKFSRLFPLGQQDLPEEYKVRDVLLTARLFIVNIHWGIFTMNLKIGIYAGINYFGKSFEYKL